MATDGELTATSAANTTAAPTSSARLDPGLSLGRSAARSRSAAARMRTPRRVDALLRYERDGQVAPANVVAAARIGRRAVIASVATSVNAEDGEHDHAVHERTLGGAERQRDLVEVGEPAGEAAQDGIGGRGRRRTAGPRAARRRRRTRRRPRPDQHRADPQRPARRPPRRPRGPPPPRTFRRARAPGRVCHPGGDCAQRGQEREESRPTCMSHHARRRRAPPPDRRRDGALRRRFRRSETEDGGVAAHRSPSAAGEAAGVDMHDGDLLSGGGASDERLDERGPERRGDDRQVSSRAWRRRPGRRGWSPRAGVRPARRQRGSRAPGVSPARSSGRTSHRRRRPSSPETGMAPSTRVRPHERAGGADLSVEARGARRAGCRDRPRRRARRRFRPAARPRASLTISWCRRAAEGQWTRRERLRRSGTAHAV